MIYFHPIFYRLLPQGVQILQQIFYVVLFVFFLYIIQSSAKSRILESVFFQIPSTYTRNSSGPKTLPCGTPECTLTSFGSCPPALTLYDLQGVPLVTRKSPLFILAIKAWTENLFTFERTTYTPIIICTPSCKKWSSTTVLIIPRSDRRIKMRKLSTSSNSTKSRPLDANIIFDLN